MKETRKFLASTADADNEKQFYFYYTAITRLKNIYNPVTAYEITERIKHKNTIDEIWKKYIELQNKWGSKNNYKEIENKWPRGPEELISKTDSIKPSSWFGTNKKPA
jgi:hypothetical protein